MFAFLKKNKAIAKKSEREQKPAPAIDPDLNRIELLRIATESDHILRKITDEEYTDRLAFVEEMGLKLAEKRITALEEATSCIS